MYIGQYVLPTEPCDQILLLILCNLHIPSVKGVLRGLEARSLCNPYRMDYQLSHATLTTIFRTFLANSPN